MKTLFLLSLAFALPAASAYQGMEMCMMVNRHKDQLEHLSERVAKMPVPDLQSSRAYTCRLVPGYGCLSRTQHALPAALVAPGVGGPAATIDLAEGFPTTNRRAHLFYMHDKLTLTSEGQLVDAKTGAHRGYVREDGGRLYALVTEAFTYKVAVTDDPALVHFGEKPERISRAYVCVPNESFE